MTRAPANEERRRWFALIALLLAAFMNLLDTTIVFMALPPMAAALGATYAALEWVIAGYTLAFATGLITGGRLGDIIGRKRVFMAGMAAFTLASVLAGLAPSAPVLIGARVLQGLAAAIMVPQVLAIIQVTFPVGKRVAALALYGITLGMAAVIGPLLGGVLTELDVFGLGWRPIFLINLPVGLVGLVAAGRLLDESRSPHPLHLDLVGVALGTVSVLLVAFPLVQGRTMGWPIWLFGLMALSLPAFIAFGVWERRKAHRDGSPLVEPSLFRERGFVAGLAVSTAFLSALPSLWFVLVIWLQVGLGYTPLTTALVAIGAPVASIFTAARAVRLVPMLGRHVLSIGFGLAVAAMGLFIATLQVADEGVTGWHAVPSLVLFGLALGLINPVVLDFVLAAVDPKDAGSAAGVVGTFQQVGAALGIAVVGALFFGHLAGNAPSEARSAATKLRPALVQASVPVAEADAIAGGFVACFVDRAASDDPWATPQSCETWQGSLASLSSARRQAVEPAIGHAARGALSSTFGASLQGTLWYHLAALLVAFGLVLLLPRRARDAEDAAWDRGAEVSGGGFVRAGAARQ